MKSATFALQISFLLGRQLVFGQEPPISLRSTTATRLPDLAVCQARYLPPSPLPMTRRSKVSAAGMLILVHEILPDRTGAASAEARSGQQGLDPFRVLRRRRIIDHHGEVGSAIDRERRIFDRERAERRVFDVLDALALVAADVIVAPHRVELRTEAAKLINERL